MAEWTYTLTFVSSWKLTKILKQFLKKDIKLQRQRDQKRWQQNFRKWKTDVQAVTGLANAERQAPNSSKKNDF